MSTLLILIVIALFTSNIVYCQETTDAEADTVATDTTLNMDDIFQKSTEPVIASGGECSSCATPVEDPTLTTKISNVSRYRT